MKRFVIFPVFLLLSWTAYGQGTSIDSLKKIIDQHNEDTSEVNTLVALGNVSPFPEAIHYLQQGLQLAQKIDFRKGEADCNLNLAGRYGQNGSAAPAIEYALNALSNYESLKDYTGMASAHLALQGSYRETEDYNKALLHEFQGEQLAESKNIIGVFFFPGQRLAPLFLAETGQTYVLKEQPDSALIYVQKAIKQNELFSGATWYFPIYLLATIQQMKGDYTSSLQNYRAAKSLAILNQQLNDTLQIYSGMSTLFKRMGQFDSSIHYAQIVATSWKEGASEIKNLLEAITNLADVYKTGNKDSAIKYVELSHALKDSMLSTKNDREIQNIGFNAQLKQAKQAAEQAKDKSRMQLYATIGGLLGLLLITAILWKNYRQQQKGKLKIEQAYAELKSTQAQLIQSEKMASLGELTAGIAHEIQNPLNFVNNFSEVNQELIEEVKSEKIKDKSERNNELEMQLLDDIEKNLEKISHHGKRADAIVKGMLLHSRTSSSIKKPTDINKLVDEYLRLAYHGLRAKDKLFNAEIKTDFDVSIGTINIVPQDIGRVLLNLINNAFYAVTEKKKTAGEQYEPTVTISTASISSPFPEGMPLARGRGVEIKVIDNGGGISQEILDKIFQPFFTTKPTGQGTGLGLSLAYDIIKAHGGEIKVETNESEGSEFVIQLPTQA